MALHLNFYHEIQREARARARDPIKLAGLGAAVVACLFIGYYFYRSAGVSKVERQLTSLQSQWKKAQPARKQAEQRAVELSALRKQNEALLKRLHGRFYWAGLLQQLAEATPENVQISNLNGTLGSIGSNASGESRSRIVTVLLNGICAGTQPRLAAEQFRTSLESHLSSRYTRVQVSYEGNGIEELGTQISLNGESLGTARFNIRLTFSPISPEAAAREKPAEAPSPTPSKAKAKK